MLQTGKHVKRDPGVRLGEISWKSFISSNGKLDAKDATACVLTLAERVGPEVFWNDFISLERIKTRNGTRCRQPDTKKPKAKSQKRIGLDRLGAGPGKAWSKEHVNMFNHIFKEMKKKRKESTPEGQLKLKQEAASCPDSPYLSDPSSDFE